MLEVPRAKVGLIILNKIKSFLKLAHTQHWVGAHLICRDDDVTADQVKVSLAVAKHVDLVVFNGMKH